MRAARVLVTVVLLATVVAISLVMSRIPFGEWTILGSSTVALLLAGFVGFRQFRVAKAERRGVFPTGFVVTVLFGICIVMLFLWLEMAYWALLLFLGVLAFSIVFALCKLREVGAHETRRFEDEVGGLSDGVDRGQRGSQ